MRHYRGMTKGGKWVYGWYVKAKVCSVIIPQDCHIYDFLAHGIEVLPETVGQSTGREDVHKKEIFAGDRIRCLVDDDIGVVYWKENVAGFYCRWGDGSDMPLNTGVATHRCEIIHDKEKP